MLRLGILAVKNSMKRLARSPWAWTIAGKPSAQPSDCCREKCSPVREAINQTSGFSIGSCASAKKAAVMELAVVSKGVDKYDQMRKGAAQTIELPDDQSSLRVARPPLSQPSLVCTAPLTVSVKIFLQPAFLSASGDE